METIQNEKLWIAPGKKSPYWPLGSTRMMQYRVEQLSDNCEDPSTSSINTEALTEQITNGDLTVIESEEQTCKEQFTKTEDVLSCL